MKEDKPLVSWSPDWEYDIEYNKTPEEQAEITKEAIESLKTKEKTKQFFDMLKKTGIDEALRRLAKE